MNTLKELSSSQHSIDLDFVPNPDEWINFLPRKPPDIDLVIKGANFMHAHPKEDLESSYYRCFNWVHVEVCFLSVRHLCKECIILFLDL